MYDGFSYEESRQEIVQVRGNAVLNQDRDHEKESFEQIWDNVEIKKDQQRRSAD